MPEFNWTTARNAYIQETECPYFEQFKVIVRIEKQMINR